MAEQMELALCSELPSMKFESYVEPARMLTSYTITIGEFSIDAELLEEVLFWLGHQDVVIDINNVLDKHERNTLYQILDLLEQRGFVKSLGPGDYCGTDSYNKFHRSYEFLLHDFAKKDGSWYDITREFDLTQQRY